ncbi:hypothetical protein ASG40_11535 [Methylobacterium sp. Leaf399]|uniref:hypothetical protein n=1 Tax=Methylobacterium sp. Leaf399 TaxID=1736364 RepID=UPI0006F78683|nr:hypothetical protein [Methylobacterium sp. Leaf399]KQT08506.1 hypothetical protein ASG40_11535 [Methylobacterium sp. Leaf399]
MELTVPKIIDRLGGPTKFGKVCGFSANPCARGHDMKMRGRIPLRYWTPVLAEAAVVAPEVTLDVLKALHPDITLPEAPVPSKAEHFHSAHP